MPSTLCPMPLALCLGLAQCLELMLSKHELLEGRLCLTQLLLDLLVMQGATEVQAYVSHLINERSSLLGLSLGIFDENSGCSRQLCLGQRNRDFAHLIDDLVACIMGVLEVLQSLISQLWRCFARFCLLRPLDPSRLLHSSDFVLVFAPCSSSAGP